jgi:DNA-binding transcriptional LysR family regulator
MLAEVEEAEAALGGMRAQPSGVLRVTAPLSFGFLGPLVGEYLQHHPKVSLELVCTDRVVDLVEERFDLAIRAGNLPDSALIGRRLGALRTIPVASPAYLHRRGRPRSPAALADHALLAFGLQPQLRWRLTASTGPDAGRVEEVRRESRLVVNDLEVLREAAAGGLGIALLPENACGPLLKTGALERVLPQWTASDVPVHAVYASTRHLASKTRAFIELLQRRLGGEGPARPTRRSGARAGS